MKNKTFLLFLLSLGLINNLYAQSIKIDSIATEDYLYDLKLFKSIIEKQHPDPFRYISEKKWDDHFNGCFHEMEKKPDYLNFLRSIPKIHDGHLSINMPEEFLNQYVKEKFSYFPIPVIAIDDRIFINTKTTELPFLSEIKSINGRSVSDIINKIKDHIQSEGNIQSHIDEIVSGNFWLNYALFIEPYAANFQIVYKDKFNKDVSIELKSLHYYDVKYKDNHRVHPINAAEISETITYRFYKESLTGKLTVNTFAISEIDAYRIFNEFFRRVNKEGYKNVIIDIRNNGGGNPQIAGILYSFIAKENFINKFNYTMRSLKIAHPEYFLKDDGNKISEQDIETYENFFYQRFDSKNGIYVGNERQKEGTTENFPMNKDAFKGNVYLVVGGWTFSAGVGFSKLFRDNQRGVIVGNETGGNAYNTFAGYFADYKLPKTKVILHFSLTDLYFGENAPKINSGIIPDKILTIDEKLHYLSLGRDPEITYIFEKILKTEKF